MRSSRQVQTSLFQKNSFLNGPKKLGFVRTPLYSKQLLKRSQETSFCSYVWKYFYLCSGATIPLLLACSVLYFCLVASWCFWYFWCVQNLFLKKNKEFKTALMTSFTLLLQPNLFFLLRTFFLNSNVVFEKVLMLITA